MCFIVGSKFYLLSTVQGFLHTICLPLISKMQNLLLWENITFLQNSGGMFTYLLPKSIPFLRLANVTNGFFHATRPWYQLVFKIRLVVDLIKGFFKLFLCISRCLECNRLGIFFLFYYAHTTTRFPLGQFAWAIESWLSGYNFRFFNILNNSSKWCLCSTNSFSYLSEVMPLFPKFCK